LAVAFAVYSLLHGRWMDGDSLRYPVWDPDAARIGTVNHALSPSWFYLWWKLGAPWVRGDLENRIHWLQVLNHLAGALSLTLVAVMVARRTASRAAGVLAASALGLSSAFFYHATQSTEPLMAVWWLLASWFLLEAAPPRSALTLLFSAAAFALSVASYQSFLTAGLGLLLLAFRARRDGLIWATAALVFGLGIFVAAACLDGVRSEASLATYLFGHAKSSLTGTGVARFWGKFSLERIPSSLLGLTDSVAAILPREGWPGLRRGFSLLPVLQKALLLATTAGVTALVAASIFLVWRRGRPDVRSGVWICVGGAIVAAYWDPYYQKLWLQPLVALTILGGGVLLPSNRARWVAGGLIFTVLLINFPAVYWRYANPDNPQSRLGAALSGSLGAQDLLVVRGWDESDLYALKLREQQRVFALMNIGLPGITWPQATNFIGQARDRRHRVLFYGVIELSSQTWADSLGRFAGLDYSNCLAWRQKTRLVWKGEAHRVPGDLYEWVDDSAR
jgi:hypothetical protein